MRGGGGGGGDDVVRNIVSTCAFTGPGNSLLENNLLLALTFNFH